MTAPPQLRRYQIMEPLGGGGQGKTFRAVDRETNTQVAIKVLRLSEMDGWKRYDLFERECEVLKSLRYPGIPRYLDRYAVEETGEFFLVMELIEGQTLAAMMAQGPLSQETLVDVLWRALDILGYLHGRDPPVIHRDIKPANLIRRPDGGLSLIDFGGVRASLHVDGGSTMIGTFGYMAPELLHGDASPAADLYSLGATIAALGTGTPADKLPHDGLQIDLSRTALRDAPLRPVLERMLEPVPSRRVGAVTEVREAMRAAIHGARPPSRPDALAKTPRVDAPGEVMTSAIPGAARSLARVPPPLSILVWIWSAMMAGLFVILEVALLPLLFGVVSAVGKRDREETARERARALSAIRDGRKALQYIARETYPLRDEGRDPSK
ncbi:MAG: serine/threonine protein kinase [Myxococcales bacterium]|nr:serine/threonine protein kinase [Myxococcales bacterium]